MQPYKVLKDFEVTDESHPLVGSYIAGQSIEAAPESVLEYLEQGLLGLFEKIVPPPTPPSPTEISNAPAAPAAIHPGIAPVPSAPPPAANPPANEPPADTRPPAVLSATHPDWAAMAAAFPTPPAPFASCPPMLYAFCKAIEAHEVCAAPGTDSRYPAGTRAYFDKNPGNLKYRGQANTVGEDKDSFAIFDTIDHGFQALIDQVQIVISGRAPAYKNPRFDPTVKADRPINFLEFFAVYDSSAGDDPVAYANDVAQALKVPATTPISALIA